jgi:hypothetical protein
MGFQLRKSSRSASRSRFELRRRISKNVAIPAAWRVGGSSPWRLLAAARSGELAGAAAARAKQRPLWIVAQRGAVEEADAGAVAGDGNQGRERSGRGKRDRRRDIPRDCDGRASRAVPPLSRSRTHSRRFRRRHRRGFCAGLRSWRGAPDRDDLGTAMVSDGGRVVMLLSVLLLSVLSADVRKPPKNQPGGSKAYSRKFAADSPLQRNGVEPSVPHQRGHGSISPTRIVLRH